MRKDCLIMMNNRELKEEKRRNNWKNMKMKIDAIIVSNGLKITKFNCVQFNFALLQTIKQELNLLKKTETTKK